MDYKLEDFAVHFENNSILRGMDLYNSGAIKDVDFNGNTIFFKVKGTTNNYETYISLDENNHITDYSCNCPHFLSGHLCKHLYASLLKLNNILESNAKSNGLEPYKQENYENKIKTKKSKIDDISKKSKFTKNDLDFFKSHCNLYDSKTNPTFMADFLDAYNFDLDDINKLFNLLRRANAMYDFLSYFESTSNIDFFKSLDLTSFPVSTNFKGILTFFIKHSNMLQYLPNESLFQLFTGNRVPQLSDRTTLFFLCLNLNQGRAIECFLRNPSNILSFFQDLTLLNYVKENMKTSDALQAFKYRIEHYTLTRMEAAYLYPLFNDKLKEKYDSFFKTTFSAYIHSYYYVSNADYESEYQVGLPLNRDFYHLLVNQTTKTLTSYDLRVMYYLKDSLFNGENRLIFAKRFRQLAMSAFRSQRPDYIKIYCSLSILLEFGDKISTFDDLKYKAMSCFSNMFGRYSNMNIETYELFYELGKKYGLDEVNLIHEYNLEA